MEKEIVVKGEIKWKASDGSDLTLEFILPFDIASQITCDIIDWKNRWYMTPNEYEQYKKDEGEFLKSIED